MSKKVCLIIMDGWGLGKVKNADAIQQANVPFVQSLYNKYPNSTLVTCGEDVGLPEGQMGNSEVGHLNLGAGRVVYQELQRINVAIKTGELANNQALLASIAYAKANNKTLHLLGLVSDGGVHSHIQHLFAILSICKQQELKNVLVHAFTDGRDCDPKSGLQFINQLQNFMQTNQIGKIATISGRYYAMDRDKRWERVKLAYDAMVSGIGTSTLNFTESIATNYANNITDEFLKPLINEEFANKTIIKDGDAALCFNFRTDRCREISEVLTQKDFPDFNMQKLALHYTTITEYDATFSNVQVMFENDNLNNTIGEVLAANNKTQIRMAETEKYPHVTFFFSGGREKEFNGETRMIAPSPKVATYDLQPEMSAYKIVDDLLPVIDNQQPDFICLNFANADMVGHTGVFEAVKKAVETVDDCVEKVVTKALANDYTILLTADHGNADFMVNEDGSPNTQHSLNLVPLFLISNDNELNLNAGKLGDVAPTILHIMGLDIPKEMTGNVLVS